MATPPPHNFLSNSSTPGQRWPPDLQTIDLSDLVYMLLHAFTHFTCFYLLCKLSSYQDLVVGLVNYHLWLAVYTEVLALGRRAEVLIREISLLSYLSLTLPFRNFWDNLPRPSFIDFCNGIPNLHVLLPYTTTMAPLDTHLQPIVNWAPPENNGGRLVCTCTTDV